jgi:hypothetical protein
MSTTATINSIAPLPCAARLLPKSRWELRPYESLIELRAALQTLDRPGWMHGMTVVLILDDHFSGHLPSLLRRRHVDGRLILAKRRGDLLLPVELRNVADGAEACGWQQVTAAASFHDALSAADALDDSERVLIFWPRWRNADELRLPSSVHEQ